MARIRSIKPEFWTSEQVVELSPTTRLLFVGMWTFCDDAGIHPASTKTLKMEVFPGDDFTSSDIKAMMAEIIAAGLVLEYQGSDGKQYWYVTGWEKHQKVDRPNVKHPLPPNFSEQSPTTRRAIADNSTSNRRQLDEQSPPEGKGREGKGREIEGKGGEFVETSPTQPAPADESPNENPQSPAPPEPSNAFAKVRAAIQQWQDADGGAALAKIASDQKYLGPIDPEITRFITHNLGKDPYRARILKNPLSFFLEQFPGWLCLPAAQRSSKAPPTGYTKPMQRGRDADQHMSEAEAMALIKAHAGPFAAKFTQAHIQNVRSKISKRTAIDLIEAIAQTINQGPAPPRISGNATEISPHGLNIIGL